MQNTLTQNITAIPWVYPTGCGKGFSSGVSNACLVDGDVGWDGIGSWMNNYFFIVERSFYIMYTLPKANIFTSANQRLIQMKLFLGWPIFRGELLVSGRVDVLFCICTWIWFQLAGILFFIHQCLCVVYSNHRDEQISAMPQPFIGAS